MLWGASGYSRLEVTGEPYILCYPCCGVRMRRGSSSRREIRRAAGGYSRLRHSNLRNGQL